MIDALQVYMRLRRIEYVDTADPLVLPGVKYHDGRSWKYEAEGQHEHLYYMYLAGVPLDVIRRRFPRAPQWTPPDPT